METPSLSATEELVYAQAFTASFRAQTQAGRQETDAAQQAVFEAWQTVVYLRRAWGAQDQGPMLDAFRWGGVDPELAALCAGAEKAFSDCRLMRDSPGIGCAPPPAAARVVTPFMLEEHFRARGVRVRVTIRDGVAMVERLQPAKLGFRIVPVVP